MDGYVIAYDFGTTGVKTCIFEFSDTINLVASAIQGYDLHILKDGGAEQDPNDWWNAMSTTTKEVLKKTNIPSQQIKGISFCAQMQGLVLVDKDTQPVRPAMSYMDNRGHQELQSTMAHGLKIAGVNIFKLIKSIRITRAVSASAKDPVWAYKWVKTNEPDVFEKIHKWLDVKEFLIAKCTDTFVMTEDSAYATLLYDTRKGKEEFSQELSTLLGVHIHHLPKIIKSTDIAGTITEKAAKKLGLSVGTPVFGGGGDASLIGIGSGAIEKGSTHMYLGTSGWVSTVVEKQILDVKNMIASIVGAHPHYFNYFAELETAGKCLEWVKDHLALDEINVYLEKKSILESKAAIHKSLYDYMMHTVKDVPAGSNGVIFTPWLHGNRCPFEDPNARGMFFNISLETGKTEMIHSVLEGVCYHLRWQLEAQEEKITTSKVIRLVGGGALAPLTCQILADILGREVETVPSPQNVGAVGAAVVMALGLGLIKNWEEAQDLIQVKAKYTPNMKNKAIYDEFFPVFKSLYTNNKKAFYKLNH